MSAYTSLALCLTLVVVLAWLASIPARNVSFVDSLWSLFFLMAGIVFAYHAWPLAARGQLVMVLLLLWSLRLSAYISWRNWGHGEDYRYQTIRANNEPGFVFRSLYIVFGLQALLAGIIAAPLLPAISEPISLNALDVLALAVWVVGFYFESVGDYQLMKFKSDPDNATKVMNTGLWRYSRHPNYFGNFCIWWGFWLFAAAAGGWWTMFSPLLMSVLLLKVSGVAMLEKTIGSRRPGYRQYVATTNAFFPGPTKRRVGG